ncbi:MAG: MFS transporter [Bacteroidetes bacterium]|nr:MFS transporter [Bacteroidota bacterium]
MKKKENPLWSIIFNIVIPILVLNRFEKIVVRLQGANIISSELFSSPTAMPATALIVALLFPLGYFLYDWFRARKTNFISILGFAGILLTGIIGVFQLPTEWIAYKEASVPLIIGIAVLVSMRTPFPLLKKLLFNPDIMNMEKIEAILEERNLQPEFEQTINRSSYFLAASFGFSAIMNFVLAKIIMHSPSGTPEFNAEYSRMLGLSFPVIALPATIIMVVVLFYLFKKIKQFTGLEIEEIMKM